ncbi:pyrroline-5-carboxylate reductase [Paenibacillus thiaminolyticus]|uniref:pyrroline-5-carboxylate reductase n=1 Tax=Paenibacillus thiaminolyticus TaxID=49283 RepID=UPI00232A84E4|nr:pyrroline-5-carboxylate reductase [Paenibacillus thiaminolyticus]WCF06163.1 pyrroline-5-carboxylate reductase [Paenibacillus thiaminolyticus]
MILMDNRHTHITDSFRSLRIGIYGAGSMAEAIIRGLTEKQLIAPDRIAVVNRSNTERLEELQRRYGVAADNSPQGKSRLLQVADIVLLAVKPKDAAGALAELKTCLRPGALLLSVVAGLSIATMQRIAGPVPVVRTMPNTSSSIGLGATGVCWSEETSAEQQEAALHLLQAVGYATVVAEHDLNMVTGLSGSGPAYVYYLMEAMIAAGVDGGLSAEQARELTVQTVRGAAEMVRLTGEEPADLRRKVTSPGGTTAAAIETLEQYQFQQALRSAIHRAEARAQEMGEQIGRETY